MPLVTIRGQLGSGAPEIGKLVAAKLNVEYVDQEIISSTAELLDCSEQDINMKEQPPGSMLGRITKALRRVLAENNTTGSSQPEDSSSSSVPALGDEEYLKGLESTVIDLALSEPIVIRGRGSQFILRHWPGALHVLTVAPLKLRAMRVAVEMNVDTDIAIRAISRFDSSRRQFIKKYFKTELEDPIHYDLIVNTRDFNFEAAASIIVAALPLKQPA